jgi:hypothetical protein
VEQGSAAEAAEWTEMGEWQVGGCAGIRGEWGFDSDRGRGSEPDGTLIRWSKRY